ncbi:hypothetical protein IMZ48_17565 [Candidatus Bathyarchaeota archaeon]|nr:hypothetical protein [Candidatus Bathyarchaeota archaeon]
MAECDTITSVQIHRLGKLLKNLKRWERKGSDIETTNPDERRRCEKATLEAKKQRALEEARSYVVQAVKDQEVLARYDRAVARANKYSSRLKALEPDCDCIAEEQRKAYRRRLDKHHELQRRFPKEIFNLIPEDALRSPTPSLAPASTPTAAEQGITSPSSDGAADDVGERSPSIQVPPQRTASFPPNVAVASPSQNGSPEPDHQHIPEPEQAVGSLDGPGAAIANLTIAGDGSAAEGVVGSTETETASVGSSPEICVHLPPPVSRR